MCDRTKTYFSLKSHVGGKKHISYSYQHIDIIRKNITSITIFHLEGTQKDHQAQLPDLFKAKQKLKRGIEDIV